MQNKIKKKSISHDRVPVILAVKVAVGHILQVVPGHIALAE